MFHSLVQFEVTGGTDQVGTIDFAGTSFDKSTGVETPADTEAVAINGLGWYVCEKLWVGTVIMSSADVDITADTRIAGYRSISGDGNRSLKHLVTTFKPTAGANELRLVIDHFDRSAKTITSLLDTGTYLDSQTANEPNRYEIDVFGTIDEDDGDTLHIYFVGKNVEQIIFTLTHLPV